MSAAGLTGDVLADGEVSERFLGRPRSMMEAAPSDSCRRCEYVCVCERGNERAWCGSSAGGAASERLREWPMDGVLALVGIEGTSVEVEAHG